VCCLLWYQSQVAGSLYGCAEHLLVHIASPGDAAGQNLSLLSLITPKKIHILEVDMVYLAFAEATNLRLSKLPFAAPDRSSGCFRHNYFSFSRFNFLVKQAVFQP